MAANTLRAIRAELRRELLSPSRFVDALLEVRAHTGEVLFSAGGCWDATAGTWAQDRLAVPRVVTLKKSQEKIGRAFARYLKQRLAGDDTRPLHLVGGGKRGGGKTWFLGGLVPVTLALVFPDTYQVSVNLTQKQRRECVEAIEEIADPSWITAVVKDPRDTRTVFLTGTALLWLSGMKPKVLRQAGLPYEYVFLNEAQDLPKKAWSNAVWLVRSRGALLGVATNRSQSDATDWIARLWRGIKSGRVSGDIQDVPASDNDALHQPTIAKIDDALRFVDPEAYAADSLADVGAPSGDLGYPAFSELDYTPGGPLGHIGSPPHIGWTNVTAQLAREALGSELAVFDYVIGADFQRRPGCCASVGEIWRDEHGDLWLYVLEYITVNGVEEDLSQALVMKGYYPSHLDRNLRRRTSALIIGDATGARQTATHRNDGAFSDSFAAMENDGWKIIGPMEHWRTGKPWPAGVLDSRAQMHALLSKPRILFSPRCRDEQQPGFPSLVNSMALVKVNPEGKFIGRRDHLTHGPDTVRLLTWRFLPRPQLPSPDGSFDTETFNLLSSVRLGFSS